MVSIQVNQGNRDHRVYLPKLSRFSGFTVKTVTNQRKRKKYDKTQNY